MSKQIETGAISCVAVDTPIPSPFSHEILNANPYAFLDDAPLEERRARAVEMRRTLPAQLAGEVGALDPAAIEEVQRESWPVVRDPDELHDALLTLVWVPESAGTNWATFFPSLIESGRVLSMSFPSPHVSRLAPNEVKGWVATENRDRIEKVFAGGEETTVDALVLGWMESIGPTTTSELAARLQLQAQTIDQSLVRLETSGQILRGRFTLHASRFTSDEFEWCHRRLLARIHRLTIGRLRKEVEPVAVAEFMRFLCQWQHVSPGSRLHGEAGLLEIINQLAGFETAASAWESHLVRTRLAKYEPEWLDRLCLSGAVSWGRLSPHPRLAQESIGSSGRRIVPTAVAPISLFPREQGAWVLASFGDEGRASVSDPLSGLSDVAQNLCRALRDGGASFFADLVRSTGHLSSEVENGLWELVTAGLVTADGFDNLRSLMDPHRRRGEVRERARRPRHTTGRWSLLRNTVSHQLSAISSVEAVARQLLRRYGVVFRDLLGRESWALSWRDLLLQYRRMELQGEVRGGRFVGGFTGEQFALPEAVESLRSVRKRNEVSASSHEIKLSASDPLNLAGVILPGPRVPAVPSNFVVIRDGVLVRTVLGRDAADRPNEQISLVVREL